MQDCEDLRPPKFLENGGQTVEEGSKEVEEGTKGKSYKRIFEESVGHSTVPSASGGKPRATQRTGAQTGAQTEMAIS